MFKFFKLTPFLILFFFNTLTHAFSNQILDQDNTKLENSLNQFLERTIENQFRDIIAFRNRLEIELENEPLLRLKAEKLFQLLILDVEMDRPAELMSHNKALTQIAQELGNNELIEISKIFGAYQPLINDRQNISSLNNLLTLLENAEKSGLKRPLILAHSLVALGEGYRGQYYLALNNLNEALNHIRSGAEDPLLDILIFWTLGYLHAELTNLTLAVEEYNNAISVAIENDLPVDVSISLLNIGRTITSFGFLEIGEKYLTHYLKFSESLEEKELVYDSYYNLAVLYYDQKEYLKSYEFSSQVNNFYSYDSWFNANINQIEAANLAHLGRIEDAKKALFVSDEYFAKNPDFFQPRWTEPTIHAKAIIEAQEGDPNKAIKDLINLQTNLTQQLRQTSSEQFGQTLQEMSKNLNEIEIEKAISAAEYEKQQFISYVSIAFAILITIGFLLLAKSRRDLKTSKVEAEQANLAKSRFLSQMSHELRTPLNSVIGFSETLNSDTFGNLNSKQKEFLGYIKSGGELLLKLINDLLDLSRIESEELNLRLKEHSPIEIFKTVLPMVQNLSEEKNIKIHIDEENINHTLLYIDKIRFEQILLNILANALKYGRPDGNVWISFQEENNQLKIIVKDDGVGIPSSQIQNVFKPFNRAGQEHSGIEGTGAGLSIAKALVNAMKGEIYFESEEGKGSTFWLQFPNSTQLQ